jgi:hypothetical protein
MPDQVYRDPGTYFEPFALRALGVVREEAELLEEAIPRFEAMDLHWHETQTVRFRRPGADLLARRNCCPLRSR